MSSTFKAPVWRTEGLYNRDGLQALFAREWGINNVTLADVDSYLVGVTPHSYDPFPDFPELPAEAEQETSYGDMLREQVTRDHYLRRGRTRKDRARYDLAGVPVFVPPTDWPSVVAQAGDPSTKRKQDRINNMRTDDLTNEEN